MYPTLISYKFQRQVVWCETNPIPMGISNNMYFTTKNWLKSKIKVLTSKSSCCKLTDLGRKFIDNI